MTVDSSSSAPLSTPLPNAHAKPAPHKQPSDAAVRARAIDPSTSFIVQAPAGSGKTELLTDRILALLATVNRPEEIVAITFTRKAAAEMHKRVMDKLRAASQVAEGGIDTQGRTAGGPHEQRSRELACKVLQRSHEKGWHILDYPARLSIRTIDSFCSHLVRSMPWLSRLGGVPAIAENADQLYQAAAQATLSMVEYEPDVATLFEHLDVDGRTAQELLAISLACRDQWLRLLQDGGDAALLSDNLEFVLRQDLERLAGSMPQGWAADLNGCVRDAAKYLQQVDPPPKLDISALASWDGKPFGTDPATDLACWQALARLLLTSSGKLRARVTKNEGFESKTAHKKAFADWLDGVRPGSEAPDPIWVSALHGIRLAPQGYTADQLATLNALLNVLRLAAAQLQLQFMQAGQVDFMEIAQRAVFALDAGGDPTDLLLKLDASIRHILVDEFQDTSQSQIVLLDALTSGWTKNDGRTVFLVGDPMQSIYRFRKAEVGLFLTAQKKGLMHVVPEPLQLTDNFRSDSGVVEWVNSTFGALFPPDNDETLGGIKYTTSLAFRGVGDDPAVEFHPVWLDSGMDECDGDDAARHTESLVVTLAQQALARHPDSAHPVAILVRARSHLEGVLRGLSAHGVACQAVELEALASRQLIDDLAQLARALSHDGDRLAWLCVLRSPVCGLTLNSLQALFEGNHVETVPSRLRRWLGAAVAQPAAATLPAASAKPDIAAQPDAVAGGGPDSEPVLPEDEALRLRHAASILLDTSNRAGAIPFAAWLQQCWQRLGGPSVYSTTEDAADSQQFFRLIERLAPYGNLDASELDAGLTRLYASSESTHPAVQVMTIHKAKGLQFDTVILMGLHRQPKADTAPLVRFDLNGERVLLGPIKPRAQTEGDPVSDYLASRDRQRASHETDRLLYVAATRACSHLHLIATVACDDDGKPKKPASGTLLARLWDSPVVTGALARKSTDSGQYANASADLAGADSRPVGGNLDAGATYVAESNYDGFDVQPRHLVRLENVPRPELAAEAPVQASRAGTAWAWPAVAGDEAVIGSVAHAWLEYLGKQGLAQWTPQRVAGCMAQFKAQLSRRGVPASQLEHAANIVQQTLVATLSSETGRWLLSAAKGYREWSLVDAAGRVSVIDLALSDEEGWLVVDYKTGMPGEDETSESFSGRMRERYHSQIFRYCQQLVALDGRPARGALYFPRADIWIDC